ncbi:unnamed protein product, partial [Laminaria digitata]
MLTGTYFFIFGRDETGGRSTVPFRVACPCACTAIGYFSCGILPLESYWSMSYDYGLDCGDESSVVLYLNSRHYSRLGLRDGTSRTNLHHTTPHLSYTNEPTPQCTTLERHVSHGALSHLASLEPVGSAGNTSRTNPHHATPHLSNANALTPHDATLELTHFH